MKAVAVNLNLYSDELYQIILDDLERLEADYIILFGLQEKVQLIIPKLGKIKYLYLGFSPLPLKGICDIFSILLLQKKLKVDITVQLYEKEETIKCSESILFHFLSNYFEGNNRYSYLSLLDEICFYLKQIPYNNFTIFIEKFISVLSYDKFINSVFSYQYLNCETNNIKKEIWEQINNKSIVKTMHRLSIDNIKNYQRWENLKLNLDSYISYVRNRNERALLFYYSLFLQTSIFYKNTLRSALCYLFLLRSLEALLTFYLLKKNHLTLEGESLVFAQTRKRVNGTGSILSYMQEIGEIHQNSIFHKLRSIRNQSYVGHGFYSPLLDKFDNIYKEITKLASNLLNDEEKKFKSECKKTLSFNSKNELHALYFDKKLIKKEWYLD